MSTAVYGSSSSKREVRKVGFVTSNRWYFKTESGESITIKRKIGFCILVAAWRIENMSVRSKVDDGMSSEHSWKRRDDNEGTPTGVLRVAHGPSVPAEKPEDVALEEVPQALHGNRVSIECIVVVKL